MAKLRSQRLVLILTLLMIFTGCGGNTGNERLSYEKPETAGGPETTESPETVRMPDTIRMPDTAGMPEAAGTPEAVVKSNVFLGSENVGGRRIAELSDMLEKSAALTGTAPVNAAVNRKTWAITSGKAGKRLNVGRTIEALKNAGDGDRVNYVFDTVQPSVRAADLKKKIRVIGKYTTVLLDRRDSRVNNIRLASGRINNTILDPGEEFSFNGIVGKRTAAKGYEEAPIIIRTPSGPKKKNAKGGGVCQISTTLYNAVEECGLKVTERHMHSKNVGYVPRGDDATVSYGSVDFKFVNSRNYPIMLKLSVSGKYLKVRILENTIGPI